MVQESSLLEIEESKDNFDKDDEAKDKDDEAKEEYDLNNILKHLDSRSANSIEPTSEKQKIKFQELSAGNSLES